MGRSISQTPYKVSGKLNNCALNLALWPIIDAVKYFADPTTPKDALLDQYRNNYEDLRAICAQTFNIEPSRFSFQHFYHFLTDWLDNDIQAAQILMGIVARNFISKVVKQPQIIQANGRYDMLEIEDAGAWFYTLLGIKVTVEVKREDNTSNNWTNAASFRKNNHVYDVSAYFYENHFHLGHEEVAEQQENVKENPSLATRICHHEDLISSSNEHVTTESVIESLVLVVHNNIKEKVFPQHSAEAFVAGLYLERMTFEEQQADATVQQQTKTLVQTQQSEEQRLRVQEQQADATVQQQTKTLVQTQQSEEQRLRVQEQQKQQGAEQRLRMQEQQKTQELTQKITTFTKAIINAYGIKRTHYTEEKHWFFKKRFNLNVDLDASPKDQLMQILKHAGREKFLRKTRTRYTIEELFNNPGIFEKYDKAKTLEAKQQVLVDLAKTLPEQYKPKSSG